MRQYEYEMKIESAEFLGRITTTEDLEVGSSVSLTLGSVTIQGKIIRKRSTWFGLKGSVKAFQNTYNFVYTNPVFEEKFFIFAPFGSLQALANECPITLENVPDTEELFVVNFSGSVRDFIQYIAELAGKSWYMVDTNTVRLFDLTHHSLTVPDSALFAELETGSFTYEIFNGYKYKYTYKTSVLKDHEVYLTDRDRLRAILGRPFEVEGYPDEYVSVYLEYAEYLPYSDVNEIYSVSSYLSGFVKGITEDTTPGRKEWDYSVEDNRVINLKFRLVLPYDSSSLDPARDVFEQACQILGIDRTFRLTPDFSVSLNVSYTLTDIYTHGNEPYLEVDVSHVPAPFRQNYASYMLFWNGSLTKLTYAKEFRGDEMNSIPTLGPSDNGIVQAVRIHYDEMTEVAEAEIEVIGANETQQGGGIA